jgi:hypothetical protein
MPPRDWKMRIKDILDAISTVQGYTKDMEYEAFVAHRKTVDDYFLSPLSFELPNPFAPCHLALFFEL